MYKNFIKIISEQLISQDSEDWSAFKILFKF